MYAVVNPHIFERVEVISILGETLSRIFEQWH